MAHPNLRVSLEFEISRIACVHLGARHPRFASLDLPCLDMARGPEP